MNTPSPKYFCPRCRAGYDVAQNYCGVCGANMHRVSGLEYAKSTRAGSEGTVENERPPRRHPTNRASDTRDPWLGRIVDNRYRVVEVIGRGGMGVVYKVEHQRMGKIAAMKVLHGDLANDRDVIQRFRREAEAVSRLNHPNTVQVFDFGMAEGALYLVMEYVRGRDIGTLLDRDGPISFERAAPLFAQVLSALSEAHELGVVHRDLKPENILVTRTHGGVDFIKVLDFGLAKLSEREELAEVTGRGAIVGTPYYMSPEQIRGDDVDRRSDIYSMGALMYRLLTGHHAYAAKTPVGVLTKHLTEPLVPPSQRAPGRELDSRIDDVIGKCMEKRAAERYENVEQLLEEIEQLYSELVEDTTSAMRGFPSRATTRGDRTASRRADTADGVDYGIESDLRLRRSDLDHFEHVLKRRRTMRIVAIPLAVAAVGGVGAYFAFRGESPRREEREPNNRLTEATLISAGEAVTGLIGKRLSQTEADEDFFRLDQKLRAPDELLTVELSGIPNMDVELYLFDRTGTRIASVNEGGPAEGEILRRRRVDGEVFVMVGQVLAPGSLPVENVSDPYSVTARIESADPELESEPNDTRVDAIRFGPDIAVTGHLDRRRDVDLLRFHGEPGRYELTVSGAASVPLRWQLNGGPLTQERRQVVTLQPDDLIRLERADSGLPAGEHLPGGENSYTIALSPAPSDR